MICFDQNIQIITSVEKLSVNGFIEWSANIFGSFWAYFVLFFFSNFFYCRLDFVFGENLCVAEEH